MGSQQSRTSSHSSSSLRWSRIAPKTIGDRSAVLSKCGPRCFLGSRKTFPICARLGAGADARAREWAAITARKKRSASGARAFRKYTAVARRARAILHPKTR
jgi:hypothetical protein